ncbi:threonine aldolase family protein [Pseudobacter ginsenosidimutans]|uniref:L-threonine aldolase n=1 Tax=Pseudobacter ginsenosidimutans TaxID=661488 RepID=A0A4Q7N688_9BACT|nr:GntG family PLP-dependent aldolase [Pseudobacter ginsenosidimutans]QEC45035.1 aminotransferase class I/II-fold pyridoxal phosphate-dependent enzyme [Pseudobacter ginsenosidimutans]RZS76530.1 L-threonine aldolase [Pseudobacter ginsenosidimutans]
MIDLRSDTFTLPTPGMLEAMMKAPVGDDVFGEDPSVNLLEQRMASLFNTEAALYCPTGTMSNQIGIKAHTQPGDEVICEQSAHVYIYEGGGIAFNSGAQVRTLEGDHGRIRAEQVATAINPDDVHKARTSLVCLENTSNRGGGSCYDLEEIRRIREVCDQHRLLLHLDGARLFNALVAKQQAASDYGHLFNSISVCLNKGMGCPIGSVLMGSKDFIRRARRIRKVLGGGMRQAGYMAAAGLYALDNHIGRLAEDHNHAQLIGAALMQTDYVESLLPVSTNIVIAKIKAPWKPAQITELLKAKQILALPVSPTQIRMVLHLGITPEMAAITVDTIRNLKLDDL